MEKKKKALEIQFPIFVCMFFILPCGTLKEKMYKTEISEMSEFE